MLIQIEEIKVNPGRREAREEDIQELANSILEVGLLNPITVDQDYTLIAGLHRLEAAKLLGWREIECTVSSLEGLLVQLAEIDENLVRRGLDHVEEWEQLARRKEIYEMLHPKTRQGQRNGQTSKTETVSVLEEKPFAEDTAEKLGVSARTVRNKVQVAKNLTPEAKDIVREHDIEFKNALKISRLKPEQQEEVASQFVSGDIRSISEYQPEPQNLSLPFGPVGKTFSSFQESIADLKDPNKDCSCTTDSFLAEITSFSRNFCKDIQWYSTPYYEVVFPNLTTEQIEYMGQQMENICQAAKNLYKFVKGTKTNELSKKDKPGKAAAYD